MMAKSNEEKKPDDKSDRSPLVDVAFATLADAGYESCSHPRAKDKHCIDCGASFTAGQWYGSTLHYFRHPWRVEVNPLGLDAPYGR